MRPGWIIALFMAVGSLAFPTRGSATAPRPDVILITLDTTRRDRLGCYGYSRNTTPQLDRLARDGVVYTEAYSTSSWTLPAHASLFTGRFPSSHGARQDPEGSMRLSDGLPHGLNLLRRIRANGLGPDEITLAQILGRAGYTTGGVVAGPWLKRAFGLDRGYAFYDDDGIDKSTGRVAERVTESARAWLAQTEGPLHLMLNYFDPHGPYRDPAGFGKRLLPAKRRLRTDPRVRLDAAYDGEIQYMDEQVGHLLDALRQLGRYDGAWIVVTSDHGELLGEHEEIGHGSFLYQEEIHVPLIIKQPGGRGAGSRESDPIQLTDILPLLLTHLELPIPERVQGRAEVANRPPVFAEVYPLEMSSLHGDWRALIRGGFKFAWNSRGAHQLFDLSRDPRENDNLYADDSERARAMGEFLQRFSEGLPRSKSVAVEVDPETAEALRNLGYIE